MKITLAMLKEKGACADQVVLFQQHFNESVEVTESVCLSVARLFDWDWAATKLLSAPALAAYDAARAPALAAYDAARAPALAAYDAVRAPALAAYDAARARAWVAYDAVRARAFAKAAAL